MLDLAAAEDCEAGVMEQVVAAASRELVLVSDLLDAPAILGKLTVLFEALSDIPWLSFSTLRAQGRAICFQRLVAGLSDGMNMFATAQTVESDPASSPVAESRHVRLLRRSIIQAEAHTRATRDALAAARRLHPPLPDAHDPAGNFQHG